MSRSLIVLLIAFCGGCQQSSQRTISYEADRPIAERLLPSDTRVVVEMGTSTPPPPKQESYEQEIARLKKGEIIALVRVSSAAGEVADGGTWIRTRVHADVERVVRARRKLEPSIEFTYSGGNARIGNVDVTTGKFPQFDEGETYLVFLVVRPGTAATLNWTGTAFRVNSQGALARVGINDGTEQSFGTNLAGRTASEVADALAR